MLGFSKATQRMADSVDISIHFLKNFQPEFSRHLNLTLVPNELHKVGPQKYLLPAHCQ